MFFRLSATGASSSTAFFAGWADDDFFHVTVRGVQQASALRGGQHGDRSGRAGGAEVRAFERIDGDVDFRNFRAVGKVGADFLADVEHGSFVALAFADDDGAAHGDGVHGLPHRLGGHLIGELAFALAHGVGGGDGRHFDHAQKSRRQVAFNVLPENAGFAF